MGKVVFLTVSSILSGKYYVVNSIFVRISLKSNSNLRITSSFSDWFLSVTVSSLIISVTLSAALKHFLSKVIIVSTDSLNSYRKRISFSNTFDINFLTASGF